MKRATGAPGGPTFEAAGSGGLRPLSLSARLDAEDDADVRAELELALDGSVVP